MPLCRELSVFLIGSSRPAINRQMCPNELYYNNQPIFLISVKQILSLGDSIRSLKSAKLFIADNVLERLKAILLLQDPLSLFIIQQNFTGSNTDGAFTTAISNSFLSS